MAFVIGHGGGYGNAGAIIANALNQEKQLAAQKAMQVRELQNRGAIASTQAQMQYEASREANKTAIAKTAIQAGLQKDMQLAEYHQSMAEAKQKAKDDASRFEQKFTTEQRVKDARLQAARRAIETSDELTEPQRQDAMRRLDVQIATNSNPVQVLGEAPKPKHPSGHEIGVPFVGEDGGLWSIEPDGTARQHSTFKESKEGVRLANEVAVRTEMAKQETKLKEKEYARRDSYASAVAKYQSTGTKGKDGTITYPDDTAVNRYASTLSRYMFPESQNTELFSAPPQIQASGALLERFSASGEQFASLSREQQRELESAARDVKRWRLENGQR